MGFKAPPVVIVSGSEAFLRDRRVRRARAAASEDGWIVEDVSGRSKTALRKGLISTSVFFKTKKLIVVSEANQVDAEMVMAHADSGSTSTTCLLVHKGEVPKKGSLPVILKHLKGKWHEKYEAPTPWKRDEFNARFLQSEAASLGVTISPQVASSLSAAVGEELGFLAWEVRKAAVVAKARGGTEVSSEILRGTISRISEIGATQSVNALGLRNAPKLARALNHVKRTTPTDPTMKIVRMMEYNVIQWMHVAALMEGGASIEQVCSQLSVPDFIVKNKLIPPARKWGVDPLLKVLRRLVAAEQAVVTGGVDPWIVLEAGLMQELR